MISSLFIVAMYKLRSLKTFWLNIFATIILAYLTLFIAKNWQINFIGFIGNSYLKLPFFWVRVAWVMHYLSYLLAMIIISYVRSDIEEKLLRQSIIMGWQRWQVVSSYSIICVLMALLACSLVILFGLIFGIESEAFQFLFVLKVTALFFLQTLLLLQFAVICALFAKNSISAVMGLLSWNFIFESMLSLLFKYYNLAWGSDFLPFAVMGKILPGPFFISDAGFSLQVENSFILAAIFYMLLFWLIPWVHLKLRDI